MINKNIKELEPGLYEISEFLLSKIKQDQNGFYWETIGYDHDTGNFSFAFNHSLWNGTGGIAWFFLVLYEHTGITDYLDTAEKSFSKIYHFSSHNTLSSCSLYDGICGVIYLGLELFRVTGKDEYLKNTSELYEKYREKILHEETEDLLIGISGILITLTLLFHYSKSKKVCDDITIVLTTLINKAKVAEQGIKWGVNQLSADSLCGFSHGNSGIGFSLLQLGIYFDHQELVWLADQAFLYESLYYNPSKNNWMDLRWEHSKEQLPNLFDWNKATFIKDDFDLNSWAHGACGIGIARIAAFKITKNSLYKKDCIKAFDRCVSDIRTRSKQNYIPFSGYGGLADFLIQYHHTFNDNTALQLASEIVLEGLEKSRKSGHSEWGIQKNEDLGLMTGTAGIALSLLMITKSSTLNSILHPELPSSEIHTKSNPILKNYTVKKAFFEQYYPKTLINLEAAIRIENSIFESQNLEEFGNVLLATIHRLSEKDADYLSDIHQLETSKIQFLKQHKGALCFHTRLNILQNEITELFENNEKDLMSKQFIRSPFIHVHESQWNWKEENTRKSDPDIYYNIFYATDQEIFHILLDPFPSMILQLLDKPLCIEELAKHFQYSEKDKKLMEDKLLQQIKELLTTFFIRIK